MSVISVNGETGVVVLDAADVDAVPDTRTVTAGAGLDGGGALSGDITIDVDFGTGSGEVTQGNDERLAAVGAYPLSAYGFVAAAMPIEHFNESGNLGDGTLFLTRVWVPGGAAITGIAVHVRAAGVAPGGAADFNGGVIYSDAGAQVGITADNDTGLWDVVGWHALDLVAPIAAQAAGRFVRVGVVMNDYTGTVGLWYGLGASGNVPLNGGAGAASGHRRSVFENGVTTPAASITPATYGTLTGFTAPVALY